MAGGRSSPHLPQPLPPSLVSVFLYSANNLGQQTTRGAAVPQARLTLTSAGPRSTRILEEKLGTDWAAQTVKIQVEDSKTVLQFYI